MADVALNRDIPYAVCYSTLASVCGWTALGVGIAAVLSNDWISDLRTKVYRGIWYECGVESKECISLTAEPGLTTVRVFMISALVFLLVANFANTTSQMRFSRKVRLVSVGLFSIAAALGVVATTVFIVMTPFCPSKNRFYQTGMKLAWIMEILAFLANPLNLLSAYNMHVTNRMVGPPGLVMHDITSSDQKWN